MVRQSCRLTREKGGIEVTHIGPEQRITSSRFGSAACQQFNIWAVAFDSDSALVLVKGPGQIWSLDCFVTLSVKRSGTQVPVVDVVPI